MSDGASGAGERRRASEVSTTRGDSPPRRAPSSQSSHGGKGDVASGCHADAVDAIDDAVSCDDADTEEEQERDRGERGGSGAGRVAVQVSACAEEDQHRSSSSETHSAAIADDAEPDSLAHGGTVVARAAHSLSHESGVPDTYFLFFGKKDVSGFCAKKSGCQTGARGSLDSRVYFS